LLAVVPIPKVLRSWQSEAALERDGCGPQEPGSMHSASAEYQDWRWGGSWCSALVGFWRCHDGEWPEKH
jgi:hypothetical protein